MAESPQARGQSGFCVPCVPFVGRRGASEDAAAAPPVPSLWEREGFFTEVEPLLELESTATLALLEGITTVTFFKGVSAAEAAGAMRARLRLVLAANPWIAGRVVRVKGEPRLQVRFPKGEAAASDDQLMDELLRVDPPGLSAHPRMSYEEMSSAILGFSAVVERLGARFFLPDILCGSQVAKPALQTRVTILSDPSDPKAFALIFSMGHTTVDGSAYYHVLNMLSEDAEVKPLSAARKHEAPPKMVDAQGKGDYDFIRSTLTTKVVASRARGQRARTVCLYVDEARMTEAKAAAVAEAVDGVSFVSVNDVLVSALARMAKARVMLMFINFRGRVEGLEADEVGNYESALLLDEGVYGSPAKLRKALAAGAPFQTHEKPLPTTWEALNSQFASASNWTAFKGELAIAGAEQLLHLPLVSLSALAFESHTIFQPVKGRVAVLALTKRFAKEDFLRDAPLSGDVSEAVFG